MLSDRPLFADLVLPALILSIDRHFADLLPPALLILVIKIFMKSLLMLIVTLKSIVEVSLIVLSSPIVSIRVSEAGYLMLVGSLFAKLIMMSQDWAIVGLWLLIQVDDVVALLSVRGEGLVNHVLVEVHGLDIVLVVVVM